MANEPLLSLNLVNVYGRPLNEKVDIILRHQELTETVRVAKLVKGRFSIAGLRGSPLGRYRIDIDPPSYQYVSQFLNIGSSGTTSLDVTFPIDTRKIISVNFPAYEELRTELQTLLENSGAVLGFEDVKGKDLYEALNQDDIRRAGLLNIAAKSHHTRLTGGNTVLSGITELIELRGDRFFAVVPKQLREDTKNSVAEDIFHEVSGSLHHPPDGYAHAGSFKTGDHYGNLQLTFFTKNDNWLADIDIDDAAGIEHVFQVIRNAMPGQSTHPYDIHEILLAFQQIDPGYSFNV